MARGPRFTRRTVETLARRVGFVCSNPRCPQRTVGPASDPGRAICIGEAAHIEGAEPRGLRYDPKQTDEERRSIANGIWLCANCHTMIDRDPGFTVERLHAWKRQGEQNACLTLPVLHRKSKPRKILLRIAAAVAFAAGVGVTLLATSQDQLPGPLMLQLLSGSLVLAASVVVTGSTGVSRSDIASAESLANRFHLPAGFSSGIYGGLIGGVLGAMIVAAGYFLDLGRYDDPENASYAIGLLLAMLIVPFGGFAGALTGAGTQLGSMMAGDHFAGPAKRLVRLLGTFVGGACSGGLAGLVAWLFFSGQNALALDPAYVVAATPPCAIAIVLGIFLYSYEGRKRFVVLAVLASAVASVPAVLLGLLGLSRAPFAWYFEKPIEGLILGATAGAVIGLVVGLTAVFYSWSGAAQRQEKANA